DIRVMMDKGCLGDSDCVKQVAEMRPFLLSVNLDQTHQDLSLAYESIPG
ncbi:hypothetical protein BZ053_004739, partial [Salmonella enterica subsp. enterica serovar Braenderup]|nr:hypothetical protein [Salmonella enterica subsp. enterica serovar Braenderup]EDY7938226.1 hypothetical protein [Salmonella enterica]EEJ0299216.1 hypothetical protein [Salmonella enterica subsp. enterica serovar Cerro]EDQ3352179.1 hypothetical protein [Salmonella enterica subsp. enterica serovar Braenderup]EDQ7240169.1 hypothetical protein [Salmonella enterica subsp. enterica serovar Braenderup]